MVQVFILDIDVNYVRTVSASLNKATQHFCCVDYFSESNQIQHISEPNHLTVSGDLSILAIPWDRSLVIYHPDYFYNPPEIFHHIMLTESNTSAHSVSSLFKYTSLSEFIRRIDEYIQNCPSLSERSLDSNRMCIAGNTCSALRHKTVTSLIREKSSQGFRVILIDLSPPYCCLFPCNSKSPHTMTDAFLRLMADDLIEGEIGHYIIPDENCGGFYLFRPVEKTDDLFECTPDLLRRLIVLLGEWMESMNCSYYALIHCGAVPFSFIYSISVLCDTLVLVNSNQVTNRSAQYERELSHLLANLPNSCKIVKEMVCCSNDEKNHFLEGDKNSDENIGV
jgi:hypothetical protein